MIYIANDGDGFRVGDRGNVRLRLSFSTGLDLVDPSILGRRSEATYTREHAHELLRLALRPQPDDSCRHTRNVRVVPKLGAEAHREREPDRRAHGPLELLVGPRAGERRGGWEPAAEPLDSTGL